MNEGCAFVPVRVYVRARVPDVRCCRFIHELLTNIVEEQQALEMVRLVCKDVVLTSDQLAYLLKLVRGQRG